MQWISADLIFDGFSFQEELFLLVDESGLILKKQGKKPVEVVKHFQGLLMPAMVNAHCHLELSAFKEKVPQSTGLLPFLKNVSQLNREPRQKDIMEQAELADQRMYDHGISVVGDISNNSDTINCKLKSPIYYHTFVECICISADKVEERLSHYENVYDEFDQNNLAVSFSLHSPYTCCAELYAEVSRRSELVAIHNQESEAENIFFENGTGPLEPFLNSFKFTKDDILRTDTVKNSVQNTERLLQDVQNKIYVHNTYTSAEDVQNAGDNVWWCFCPKANLFIEETLPDIKHFIHLQDRIIIGTDSLASNDDLNLLAEIMVFQEKFSEIGLERMLQWATLNGSKALKVQDQFGSFEIGKSPGILHLKTFNIKEKLLSDTKLERLF